VGTEAVRVWLIPDKVFERGAETSVGWRSGTREMGLASDEDRVKVVGMVRASWSWGEEGRAKSFERMLTEASTRGTLGASTRHSSSPVLLGSNIVL
jgi:hypothetical protein